MYEKLVNARNAGRTLSVASVLAVLSASPGAANAQQVLADGVAAPTTQAAAASASMFWTADRFLSARPMAVHPSEELAIQSLAEQAAQAAQAASVGGQGSLSVVQVDADNNNFVHPPVNLDEVVADQEEVPASSMQFGLFTEARVTPNGANGTAVNSYPYRAAGALFFHDPRTNGNFICTASMHSPRIILTAGHCVAHGSTDPNQRYWYDNFLFIPAYNNGIAPYGKWNWSFANTTGDWWNNGNVPNAHDFAMIEAADQGTNIVGKIVGWLGWETSQLSSNHFTTLGYPCNLDSCLLMQRNDAQTSGGGGSNTWIQGTSMRGGASGGPWVQDFGVLPVGAPAVPFGGNVVVGVTSYGPIATNIGYLGASQFDAVFVSLHNQFCAHRAGNC